MRPLFPTFTFLGLAAAAIITVVSCSTQRISPNQTVEMFLGDPDANPPKYVDLRPGTQGKLVAALQRIKAHNGICEITFLDRAGGTPVPHYCEIIGRQLNTQRVIKSAAAKHAGTGNSAANDPNLMYRIASPDPSDISDVAVLLK